MGWTTDLYCMISFPKETYRYRSQVEGDLADIRGMVRMAEDKLKALALMTEPLKMYPDLAEDGGNAVDFITQEVNETLESLAEWHWEQSKLELLLDNWEKCHTADGRPVLPPENVEWDAAFIDGDFIREGGDGDD